VLPYQHKRLSQNCFRDVKNLQKNMLQIRRNNMYYLALFSGSLCGPLLET
jgi:hypothetical protein